MSDPRLKRSYRRTSRGRQRRTAFLLVLTLILGLVGATGVVPATPATAAVSVTQVSNWKLDAGTGTTAVDSVGTKPATLGSGATWTTGLRGASALAVNGTTNGSAATSGPVVNTSNSFSVTAYVKFTNVTGYQTVLSQDGTNVSAFFLGLKGGGASTGKLGFSKNASDSTSAAGVDVAATSNAVANQWYHIAGVYNATAGTVAFYQNGRLQQTAAATGGWNATGNFHMGRARYSGSPVDFVNGVIDEVRVYSGALTAADVEQVADSAYYKLDEGSGTTAIDAGLTQLNGTLTNGPTYGPGPINSSVSFDGTNDYIDGNRSTFDTSKSFSVSAWARSSSVTAARVVASAESTNYSAFTLAMRSDGKWAFARASSDVNSPTLTSAIATASATANSWYHLAGVYDSVAGTLTLYVDGVKQGASVSYTTGWRGTGDFMVGRSLAAGSPAGYFNGAIDEVHTYPFAIDDGMAAQLADPTPPPSPATPTATTTTPTSATLSWVAPRPISGSPTTGYVVTPYVNGTAGSPQTFNSTATSQTLSGLTSGSSYRFTVAAINANGTSSPSAQSAAVVPTATSPAAPAGVSATAGSLSATLSWIGPADNGNAITGYVVTPYIGATAQTAQTFASTATTQTVTGLTAGTAYTFTVAATNGVGTGAQSAASNEVTPNANPTIAVVAPPSGQVGVAYSFTFTRTGGTSPFTWSVSAGSLPAGLALAGSTGVLSGTPTTAGSYPFTAKVTDASGATDTSAVTLVITDKPARPEVPTASAGVTSATVSWVAPASNGSAITGYVVTPYIGAAAQTAQTFNSTATSQTLTGLTAGTACTFTVAAVNALGTGPASNESAAVTPYNVPGAPTAVTGTAGAQAVNLSWTAPTTNGSAITGYRVTPYIGATAQTPVVFASAATSQTVTGLTAGTAYTFRVEAQNAAGYGAASAASPAVTPNADVPAAPATPTATAGALSASVSWVAPASNGSAITGYVVTPYLNGVAQTATTFDASATTRSVTGLTVGGSYRFTVAAVNAVGTSSPSAQSNVVVPYSVPDAPVISAATAGTQRVTLTWTAPNSNGSTVTGYVVTPYIGGTAQPAVTFASAALTQTVTGLTAGTAYTFRVAAQNAAGTGAQSAASSTVTPNATPTLTFGNPPLGQVGVTYSNQLAVTGGTSPFTWSVTAGTLPAGLGLSSGGLLSGTPTAVATAAVTIQVVDASGQIVSKAVTVTIANNPSTPAAPTAMAGLTSAVVTWTAPASNNSTITVYVITPYRDGVAQTAITVDPSAKTRRLNGLTAGSSYTFTVAATNAIGTSAASTASNSVTPYAALSEPTITAVSARTTSAQLTWTAPTSTGGSAITGYVVTPYIGSTAQTPQTFNSTATTQTINGLVPGTAYTFKVASTNNSGTSVLYRIDAGGGGATSIDSGPAWAADNAADNPLRNSGSNIADFGPVDSVDSTVPSTMPISQFNSERWDPLPAPDMQWSFPVTTSTNTTVRLYFNNGSSATANPGQRSFDVALEGSTVLPAFDVITAAGGTKIGTMREFAVISDGTINIDFSHIVDAPIVNAIELLQTGTATTGPQSAASSAVTPNTSPSLTFAAPPAGTVGSTYSQQLTVNDGTSPFVWSIASGTLPSGITLSSGGLLSGTPTAAGTYSFTVQVTDASGQTATRAVSLLITDRPATPAAPTADAGVTSATVTWVAPVANGSAITGYTVTPYLDGVAQTPISFDASTTTRTITGLVAPGNYRFTVAATNAAGTSSASSVSNVVLVYDVPGAPSITAATAGSTSATLTWTEPAGNGRPVSGYVVTPYIGGVAQTAIVYGSTATTRTVTGLTAGTAYTFRVAATNLAGTGPQSAASSAVTPNAAPTLTFGNPPLARVGVAFSYQFTVNGGTAPFTWSVLSGTLPAGLTLSSGGLLSGTPTTAGNSAVTIRVVDASGSAANRATTVSVADVPAIPAAPTATAGLTSAVLSWTAPATNNSTITAYVITPYRDGVAQTAITVDPSAKTRTLNGLTAGGVYAFTVAATNAAGTSAASSASNSVIPYAALSEPAITAVTAGSTSATLSWTAPTSLGGSAITGYVVTPYIGGVAQTPQTFSGAATTRTVMGLSAGTAYTFKVAATNNSGTTPLYRIDSGGAGAAAIDGGPAWSADIAADSTLRNSGSNASDFGPITSVDSTVPSTTPISIFSSERWDPIGGTDLQWSIPATSGTNVKVRLFFAEAYWTGPNAGQRVFNMALEGSTVLPSFDVFAAAGGNKIGTMREFAVTSDGTINLNFTRAVDNPIINGIEILETGTAATGPQSSASSSVTPNASPTLTFPATLSGQVNVAYSNQLTVNDGTSPFSWAISAGALPPGLTLGASTGLLSGTPTTSGSYSFTVQVTDASGQTATRAVTLTIAAVPTITFTPAAGQVNVAYSQQPTVTGGTGPYAWTLTAGSLPSGLTLNASTGLISGTPTAAGSFSITLRVTDANAQVANKAVTLSIAGAPTLTSSPPAGRFGVGYSFTFAATGGTGPFSYSVIAGTLPTGLTLTSAGVLSGNPRQVGNFPFTVRATDANGQTATNAVTLVLQQAPVQVTHSANVTSTVAGATVTYTVSAANVSSESYNNVEYTVPLTGVLDDATYNADASVNSGTVSYSSSQLVWTVDQPAGQTRTMTYSVTVLNPDPGNKVLASTVTSSRVSSNCYPDSTETACTATSTVSGLTIAKTASVTTTTPGSLVTFTTVVTNSGQTPFTGATFADNLVAPGVLDDATYNGNAAATLGTVSYASSTLTWTGNLAVGASATITYSVTVTNPNTGNRSLSSTIVSSTAGSGCPAGSPAASCTAAVTVLIPGLSISTSASLTTATPGQIVPYTVTVTNTGETAYAGITVNLALAGAIDDATYTSSSATTGTVAYNAGTSTLAWTGDLALGASVTINASVTVRDPDPGDKAVTAIASSSAPGSSCPVGSASTTCRASVSVLVPALTITKTADVATTTPGSLVTYTVAVTNSGQTPYTGAAFSDVLTGVLDDATYTSSSATSGTVGFTSPTVSWSGDLAVGATATITYRVTVRSPDPGDKTMASTITSSTPGSNCASGSNDARCLSTVTVLIPGLSLSTVSDAATTTPGSVVRVTNTVTNTGQTTYTNVVVTLDVSGAVDDATPNFDGEVSRGTVVENFQDFTATWTLTLAPGETATARASFTVVTPGPQTGDRSLITAITSSAAGSSCPTFTSAPACRSVTPVLVPGLRITKTANAAAVTPGDSVTFTVLVENVGETAYAAAAVTDDLTPVLSDAIYSGGATATVGTVSYSAPTLSWSGPLGVGASATITFSVTVRDPDPGNKQMVNRAVSTSPGSNCPAGSSDSRCVATVSVLVPGLTIVKTASVASTAPGSVVGYTVTVTNSGTTAYTGATLSDPLAGVLDDATYDSNVAASSGTAGYAGSTVSWTGNLAVGASATVTYSVTVRAADVGNDLLANTVTSTTRGNNCASGSIDTRCSVTVPVARLILQQSATETYATPGSTVHLSTTWSNTGQVAYTGISVVSPRADTSDDTVPTGDQTTSSGTLVRTATAVTWTGDIPVGGVVTGNRTLVVKNPDPGNKNITATLQSTAAGNNCQSGTTDARCTFAVPVLVPQLTLTKTANTTATVSGGTVNYTITAQNTGETAYLGAAFSDSLVGVLDDATYNANASVNLGTVTYSASTLSWSGDLPVGATATLTYSVTVKAQPGDKTMVNLVVSDTPGSTCPAATGNAACRSTVVVLTPALTIVKTASVANATLDSTVSYSVLVTNSGQTSYPSASFSDSLAGVLDDATYNGDAATTGSGTVGYTGGVLSWSGALSPGASATITYSVAINNPESGDGTMTNTVVSTTTGSNCASSSTDARCTAVVAVTDAVTLTLTKTANALATAAGAVVDYTVTATNSSELDVSNANFTDSLTGILDDAAYNGDEEATSGSVTATGSSVSWTGDVLAGETVTVTYSVTVLKPTPGNKILSGAVSSTSPAASNNCLAGSTDPRCSSTVPVAELILQRAYTESSTTPGSLIHQTATFTNTGQYDYNGISVSSLSADTLDDAIPSGDQTATSGSLVLTATALIWTGDIPVGGSVTVTGTLRVKDPDPGNRVITGTMVSSALGNNCPTGGSDARCTSTLNVLVPQLTITKTAAETFVVPGADAGFTITVNNSGETPYTGVSVVDSLAGVLDDAVLNSGATASAGTLIFSSPTLTWTGDLAVGATVTLTYSVRAKSPATGDKSMVNTVSSNAVGSSCPVGGTSSACMRSVDVRTPALTIASSANRATANPGQDVSYTVTVSNTGQTDYPGGSQVTVPLAGLTDDAGYNGDATASDGTVSLVSGALRWTGALDVGDAVTLTFSVTVDDVVTGDHRLNQVAVTALSGSNCASGSTDSRCATSVPIADLQMSDVSDVSTTKPTGVVRFTETYTNIGQVPFVDLHITIDGSDVFDDATFNGDASTSSGSLQHNPDTGLLIWTGSLAPGESVTNTGSVTVNNPPGGNLHLRTRIFTDEVPSNCPSDSTDPRCLVDVEVLTPHLAISTAASSATSTPGSLVTFTTTVTNDGQTPYTGATVRQSLADMQGDATYANDAAADTGVVGFADAAVTWTGDLAVNETAVITYSVLVSNPPVGDRLLANRVVSDELGSTCATGSSAASCRAIVAVLIPSLTLGLTANVTATTPGDTVSYTWTISNSGQTDYAAATATLSLAGVLDDASYAGGAQATTGSLGYSAPTLTWSGALAQGATATVTYAVQVKSSGFGNRVLSTSIASPAPGSNCTSASPCVNTVSVQLPGLDIATTADVSTATPGDRVAFTVTISNTGELAYLGVTATTSLAGILDDATLSGPVTASAGVVDRSGSTLTWQGSLLIGATVTITYHAVVAQPAPLGSPGAGDRHLTSTWRSNARGSTCPTGGTDPACSLDVSVLVPQLTVSKSADVGSASPGDEVTYEILLSNDGETPSSGATFSDSLAGLLAEADFNGDQVVIGGGTLDYSSEVLSWTGNLPVGASARITYSVTVRQEQTGDKQLTNTVVSTTPGSTCPADTTNAACTSTVQVLIPGLTITKAANASSVTAGDAVVYTISVTNTGETAYAPATFSDPLAGVLDDGTLAGAATATSGTATYTPGTQTLSWSGALAVGASATISYTLNTAFPGTGDHSLVNTVSSTAASSNCNGGSDPRCASVTSVLVPELTVSKSADTAQTVAGDAVGYTLVATNTGEASYPEVVLTDPLAEVGAHAAYEDGAVSTKGQVVLTAGVLSWTGSLAVGESVVINFSVTVDADDPGNATMVNRVVSDVRGSSCPTGSSNASCAASTFIQEGFVSLTGLSPSFLLSGPPGAEVQLDGAVVGTVTTNNLGGYSVTVQGQDDDLTGSPGNPETIGIEELLVRGDESEQFRPLVPGSALLVRNQSFPSNPTGDAFSNDYQMEIPFVSSDEYSTTLDYIVTAN